MLFFPQEMTFACHLPDGFLSLAKPQTVLLSKLSGHTFEGKDGVFLSHITTSNSWSDSELEIDLLIYPELY